MEYTIDELRNKIFGNVLEVYDVFKNHFGEQYVDLQKIPDDEDIERECSYDSAIEKTENKYKVDDSSLADLIHHYNRYYIIYVWWPQVTITNEHNKSVTIQDLYAQVKINIDGCIPYEFRGFMLNRATYPVIQFLSGYMHSHICSIPKHDFTQFQEPCLGRGPIKETIRTLNNSNDTVMWMLFCEELSRYVTVESLTGRPYQYLEKIGIDYELRHYTDFESSGENSVISMVNEAYSISNSHYYLDKNALKAMIKDFIQYYLQHGHLTISFEFGKFICGMTYYEYMIDVSNSFIDYYNTKLKADDAKKKFLFDSRFLITVFVKNNKFSKIGSVYSNSATIDQYQDKHVLTFKGNDIRTKIIDDDRQKPAETILLNYMCAMYVLDNILKIINYRFKDDRNSKGVSGTETTARTHKTVFYI